MWLLLSSAMKSMPKPTDGLSDGLSSMVGAQAGGCGGKKRQNNPPNPTKRPEGSGWALEEAAGEAQEFPARLKHHQDLVPLAWWGPTIHPHTFPRDQLMPEASGHSRAGLFCGW